MRSCIIRIVCDTVLAVQMVPEESLRYIAEACATLPVSVAQDLVS